MLDALRWGNQTDPDILLVLCHGVGAEGAQMEMAVNAWKDAFPSAAFLAPNGPEPFDMFPLGHQWFSLRDRTPAILDAAAGRAAPALLATMEAERQRLQIPPGRVVIGGFSQGAMMALYAGLRRNPPPAAILAYSGALLDTPELAASLVGHPPVLLVHGETDDVVPFTRGPEAHAALQRLGIPVQTCWCPGTGHWVDQKGLDAGKAFLATILHG